MSHIAACAKGKRKTAYAFKWKYMESQEFKDAPGLIVLSKNEVVKTPKVKKWIDKHNPTVYKILYLENPSNNFKVSISSYPFVLYTIGICNPFPFAIFKASII